MRNFKEDFARLLKDLCRHLMVKELVFNKQKEKYIFLKCAYMTILHNATVNILDISKSPSFLLFSFIIITE